MKNHEHKRARFGVTENIYIPKNDTVNSVDTKLTVKKSSDNTQCAGGDVTHRPGNKRVKKDTLLDMQNNKKRDNHVFSNQTQHGGGINDDVSVHVGAQKSTYDFKKGDASLHTRDNQISYIYETSDDTDRKELLWSTKIEATINEWRGNCLKSSNWHAGRAKHHKRIFYIIGIPAAIIPMILAATGDNVGNEWHIIMTMSLILTSMLTIIQGFLNPGKKSESHMNFNSLYGELAVEISSELARPQYNRQAADVFIQRIMDKYNSLNNRAPFS